jgi:hypothetical protein
MRTGFMDSLPNYALFACTLLTALVTSITGAALSLAAFFTSSETRVHSLHTLMIGVKLLFLITWN